MAPDIRNWRVRAPDGDEGVLPPGWLAQLVNAARGRWVPAAPPAGGDTWVLLQGSVPRARVTFDDDAVTACDLQSNKCEKAALDESARITLRQGLQR